MRYKLTAPAKADLQHIGQETLTRFGKEQQQKYREILTTAFERLTRYPECGMAREELGKGVRSMTAGSHVVLYRNRENHIEILAIPHHMQDIGQVGVGEGD